MYLKIYLPSTARIYYHLLLDVGGYVLQCIKQNCTPSQGKIKDNNRSLTYLGLSSTGLLLEVPNRARIKIYLK